ncbi:hypothetical protein AAFX24_07940 [Vibrio mediterranei]|uniref:hypothetical protein n=1 Tax=Vibrio mediterranei TaxID=689 RepID=UPI0038CE92DE
MNRQQSNNTLFGIDVSKRYYYQTCRSFIEKWLLVGAIALLDKYSCHQEENTSYTIRMQFKNSKRVRTYKNCIRLHAQGHFETWFKSRLELTQSLKKIASAYITRYSFYLVMNLSILAEPTKKQTNFNGASLPLLASQRHKPIQSKRYTNFS